MPGKDDVATRPLRFKLHAGQLRLTGRPWQLATSALQRQRGRLFLAPQVPPLPPRQRGHGRAGGGRLPAWGLMQSLRLAVLPADIPAPTRRWTALAWRTSSLPGWTASRAASASARPLARALVSPASLWLVDEPLGAGPDAGRAGHPDPDAGGALRERGITMLVTMHQVETALAHFSRILGLRDGAVAFDRPRPR